MNVSKFNSKVCVHFVTSSFFFQVHHDGTALWWQPLFNDKKCREGERIKTVIIAESPKNPKSNSFQNTSARWCLPAECTVLGVLHKNATRKKVPCWWKSQKKAHTREEETLNNYTPFDVSPLLFLIMLTSYLVCNLCCLTNSWVPNSKGIENTRS